MGNQMTDEKISKQARAEALKIARGTQRPGQKKEQTKLIAQGVEKGIAEFRKREKAKARERDKLRKKAPKNQTPYSRKLNRHRMFRLRDLQSGRHGFRGCCCWQVGRIS